MEVSVGEAKALRKMVNMLGYNRGAEEKSPREKFLDAIQKEEGLRNMIEFANSKGLVEEGDVEEGNLFGKKARETKKGDKFTVGGKTFTKEELEDQFLFHLIEKEGILRKLTKAGGAIGGAAGGSSLGGVPGGIAGAFAGYEGADMFATALDNFLRKNNLNASGIKSRLTGYMERVLQDFKDDAIGAGQKLRRIYKDRKASESVDLNDIRHDYGVTPVSEGGNAFDMAMTDAEDVIMTCQDQEECLKDLEALIVDNAEDWDDKYANEVVQDYITLVVDKGIEGAKEYVEQQNREPEGAPLESKGAKPDYIDIDGDGDKEEPMKKAVKDKKKKDESFDASAEQSREEEAYNELVDAYDKGGEEGLCKAIGCSIEELDDEMSEFARDHSLHMDDDRDEIIHGYIEQLVDNADWKDHGEMDHDVDEDLQRMRHLAGLEEQSADIDVGGDALSTFAKYRDEVEKNYGEKGLEYYYDVWQEVKRQRGSKANAGEAYRMTVQKFAGQEMTKQLEM